MRGAKTKRNISGIIKTVLLFIFLALYITPFVLVLINSLKRKAEWTGWIFSRPSAIR